MIAFGIVVGLGVFFGALTLFSFLDYVSRYGTTHGCVPATFAILACVPLLWAIISYNTPAERESRPLTVSTVDSVDIVVDGSDIVNLNERFDRDFEPGDKVYYKSSVVAGGLWYEGYYSTKE